MTRWISLCIFLGCSLFSSPLAAQPMPAAVDEAAQKRNELVDGVDEVALPGIVGSLCVFGPKSYPIVTAVHDSSRLPIIAGAIAGKGRVIACAHGGYIEKDHAGTDTEKLMTQLSQWASGKPNGTDFRFVSRRTNGLSKSLTRAGHQPIRIDADDWLQQITDVDLLILRGDEITDQNIPAIQTYVADGGGLIVADAAWVWSGYRKNPGQVLSIDHTPNKLLQKIGIVWTPGNVSRDAAGGVKVQRPLPANIHALAAIRAISDGTLQTKEQQAQARIVIEQPFAAIPQDDSLLMPSIRDLAIKIGPEKAIAGLSSRRGLSDLAQRIAVGYETSVTQQLPIESMRASPLAKQFPGSFQSDRRENQTLTLNTHTPRWHSTGMYAAPGEIVSVDLPSEAIGKGIQLRIGAHKDRLWHKTSWRRAPEVTRTFAADKTSTEIANPFGGLIYLELPKDPIGGEVEVSISNAIPSPVYIHGETDIEQWRSTIRKLPGPWAEIGSDKIIFTVPSSAVRALENPDEVMNYWNSVMDACADLAMIDHQRPSPERFVVDVQISAGYMHAGYPIMAPSNLAGEVLDVETLQRKGNWGVFHEIGHNHQEPEWTYGGMTEVTVNLFSMYVYDTLHPGAKQHPQIQSDSIAKMIADFEKTGRLSGPWPNLIPYIELKDQFGWESYRSLFQTYQDLPPAERPKSDLEKRSQWMVRFSNEVGRNLTPFFEYWKIETSDDAKAQIKHLPEWNR